MKQIPESLAQVRERIRSAAIACGRDPDAITLLAVSKTKPAADVDTAYQAGQRLFGENYLQDALPKIKALAGRDIEWHFIGRIQGNKAAEISQPGRGGPSPIRNTAPIEARSGAPADAPGGSTARRSDRPSAAHPGRRSPA